MEYVCSCLFRTFTNAALPPRIQRVFLLSIMNLTSLAYDEQVYIEFNENTNFVSKVVACLSLDKHKHAEFVDFVEAAGCACCKMFRALEPNNIVLVMYETRPIRFPFSKMGTQYAARVHHVYVGPTMPKVAVTDNEKLVNNAMDAT